jgi:hypothetical protein
MKLKNIIMAGAALAFLTIAAGSLQAQLTQILTITATASLQGGSTDNGTVTTYAAPIKHTADTKQILAFLAQDENVEGNYGSTNFPSGAKLVIAANGAFQVLDKSDNLLVDVSDILSSSNPGTNNIFSGKQNDTNGLASPTTTDLSLLTITFDDSNVGEGAVGLTFSMTGIGTGKTTDTTPNVSTGAYTETDSGSLTSATGEGSYQGDPLVVTGSAKASGKGTLNIND